MHLNHVDLSVPDLNAAADFFCKGFGFAIVNARIDDGMIIMKGDGPFIIALTRCAEPVYPKDFHIGFLQESREALMKAYRQLVDAGIEVTSPPAEMYGALLFYCRVPGGILVEVAYRPG